MTLPRVADSGDGLQDMKSSCEYIDQTVRTVHKGWCSSLGVGRGANNSSL